MRSQRLSRAVWETDAEVVRGPLGGLRGQTYASLRNGVRPASCELRGRGDRPPAPPLETLASGRGAEGSKPAWGRSQELLNHPIPAGCGVSAALAGTLAGEGDDVGAWGLGTAQLLTESFPPPPPFTPDPSAGARHPHASGVHGCIL